MRRACGPVANVCKPAAGTLVNLPNGKVLYWDALEGTENNTFSIVAEGGATFTNDSTRLLDGLRTGKPTWSTPRPFGAVELTGLKSTRIYDPRTNAFTQTRDTAYRRWYPTLVETGDEPVVDHDDRHERRAGAGDAAQDRLAEPGPVVRPERRPAHG